MQRIMIIGSSGSGKSTLSLRLAALTGLPLIHLDQEYWRPGWVEPSKQEWLIQLQALTARPAWIMDGHFGGTLAVRMAEADTVIFLDVSRWVCVASVLWRVACTRGRRRADMAEGCPERFDLDFLLHIWRWPRNSKPRALAAIANFQGRLVVLKRRRDVDAFLTQEKANLQYGTT